MRKICVIVLVAMMAFRVSGQDMQSGSIDVPVNDSRTKPYKDAVIYIATSTGINNNTGIIGFSFELALNDRLYIDAGPGTGTWGNKVYGGIKYFLKPGHKGFAFGAGLTYCPGVHHGTYDIQTVYGNNEQVELNKNPQSNILFAAYKYWKIGQRSNRLFAELGWSAQLSAGDKITQVTGDQISEHTTRAISSEAPGGPVLAFGVLFGLH